jgi:hypothetical protein
MPRRCRPASHNASLAYEGGHSLVVVRVTVTAPRGGRHSRFPQAVG